MFRPRIIFSTLIGLTAALCALTWLSSSAHGQVCAWNACCGWRYNTYYETTYGRCGCCTCQPTYFTPRLRPDECYTACGHCGAEPACLKCRGPQEDPVADCGPWPYPGCLENYVKPSEFQRLGEIPNDMLTDSAAIAAP